MVRIINQQPAKPAPNVSLDEKSKALLQLIGVVIADQPEKIQTLLESYSVSFDTKPSEKELADKLLKAVAECDQDFNNDLAAIILDSTLDNSSYDSFDIKSLFNKGGSSDANSDDSKASGGAGGGGLWAGVANAVGGIGSAIGQGFTGKQARDQASANTLQGIYAYKSQLAANANNKGKNNSHVIIALFAVVGLAIAALILYNKKQNQLQIVPQNH